MLSECDDNSPVLLAAGAAVGFTAGVVDAAAGLDDTAPLATVAATAATALPG